MTDHAAFIARFERAAAQAGEAEDDFRREAARRIETLARERRNAFRRLNLVRSSASAMSGTETAEDAAERARLKLAADLGWLPIGPRQALVLDRLQPAFLALAGTARDDAPVEEAEAALLGFEEWYRSETEADFYDLFDRYVQETPVVDF
ncbi:hypothetical protein [Terrihabitans rhizophilus]|uniref:Uncharacterized protein n=1 Tax=Terrihabitans rhizophilus TaxID=3092662 RepID=A0ABU4RRH6_9HYPH|nr:hypothetical protein [Terrihabitans sp. PJ23]MDX6807455.1 hypothetical protein [Terrihabitans sp. PJ23]